MQVLEKGVYDPARPLEAFLVVHLRNRLSNFKRDRLHRSDSPCPQCHGGTPCQADGSVCKNHAAWQRRNRAKANLLTANSLNLDPDWGDRSLAYQPQVVEQFEAEELRRLIDENLPLDRRAWYLRLLDGAPVPTHRRHDVQRAVLDILTEAGWEFGDDRLNSLLTGFATPAEPVPNDREAA